MESNYRSLTRPLKNAQFCLSSRKAKNIALAVSAGASLRVTSCNFEADDKIGQKGAFCKGL